jgi:hypothetical protein
MRRDGADRTLSSPASSTSAVESFITNSRVRSTPLLGRASSRSFVWSWYQIWGRSRYDRRSCAASQVMVSSCVMARHRSRPPRSFRRNISSPMASHLPVCCQTSAGFSTGMATSCPPMAFISSRMMRLIFSMTRMPSGRYMQARRRSGGRAARTISLCETTSTPGAPLSGRDEQPGITHEASNSGSREPE